MTIIVRQNYNALEPANGCYDMAAVERAWKANLYEAIRRDYPEVEVLVSVDGRESSVVVDPDDDGPNDRDEAEHVRRIAGRVWEDLDWGPFESPKR